MEDIIISNEITEEFELEITQISTNEFELDIAVIEGISELLPIEISDVSEDGFLYKVPENYELESVDVENETDDITISLGTTPGNDDILSEAFISANSFPKHDVGFKSGFGSPAFDVFISSAAWNTTLTVYLRIKRIR